jgi:phosphoribosylamine--glycine ligase
MKVLIFGNDSCAHALGWKLVNSAFVQEMIFAPGNGGTSFFASSVDLPVDDLGAITSFVIREEVDLVVADAAGISAGLTDEVAALPLPIVGSSSALKPLHYSRCAAREWLQQHGLPTPRGRVCTTQQQAEKYAATLMNPIVVVADGLAGPAIVCHDRTAVPQAIADCLDVNPQAGVIIEEVVSGPVVTASFLSDGSTAVSIPAARLHGATAEPYARVSGAHSAATALWTRLESHLEKQIRQPLLAALQTDGRAARGWIGTTCVIGQRGPLIQSLHLVPSGLEIAATLPRLESDLLPLLIGCARGTLAAAQAPVWRDEAVLSAALSRTGTSGPGADISFSAFETFDPGVLVFHHATTSLVPNTYVPFAARFGLSKQSSMSVSSSLNSLYSSASADPLVAIVVTRAPDIATARERLYTNLQRSSLAPGSYREDLGTREL